MNEILAKKLYVFVIIYLDDILIHTDQADYVDTVWWVMNPLREYSLYNKLKKYCFHQGEIQCLNYEVFLQNIYIENKRIEIVRDLPKLQPIRDIRVFMGFVTF